MSPALTPTSSAAAWRRRLLHGTGSALGLFIFCVAIWVLRRWLEDQSWRAVLSSFGEFPAQAAGTAVSLAVGAYLVLIGYDMLALRFIGRTLPIRTVATTALVANALGNSFGNTLLTGTAVRYAAYAPALSPAEIATLVLFCSLSFWLGFALLSAVILVFVPLPVFRDLTLIASAARPLGALLFALLAGYLVAAQAGKVLTVRGYSIRLPSLSIALGQMLVGCLDITSMSAVFYSLLPKGTSVSLMECIGGFLVAIVVGNLSLIPGGIGVFEASVVAVVGASLAMAQLAAALLVFRVLYFFAPLALTAVVLFARGGFGLWRQLRRPEP